MPERCRCHAGFAAEGPTPRPQPTLRSAAPRQDQTPHRAQHGVGPVVAIDELHAGSLGDLAEFLNAVQNLTLDRQQNPLAIIGAGLPSVREILTQPATFGERSRWMGLQELSNSDLAHALKLPAVELDVDWDAEAEDWALAVGEPVRSGHQQYRRTDIARGLRGGGGSDVHNYHFDRDITHVCSNCAQTGEAKQMTPLGFTGIPVFSEGYPLAVAVGFEPTVGY